MYITMSAEDNSLAYAIEQDNPELVQQALAKGANPKAKDSSTGLPMFVLASLKSSETDVLQMLLDRGANINVQTSGSGHTALMTAALGNKPNIVSFLIQKGADLQIKNKAGKKAEDYATRPDVKAVFERLAAAEKNLPTGMSKEIAKYAGSKRRRTTAKRRRQSKQVRGRL